MGVDCHAIGARLKLFNRIRLGDFPSPIHQLQLPDGRAFWLKDDGACSKLYGGNKVRKLEFILADASKKSKRILVVCGDLGSHTVKACSLWGRYTGFDVWAIVYSHKWDDAASCELTALQETCARVVLCGSLLETICRSSLLAIRSSCYSIPLGASSPLGTLGYVCAAMELVGQIQAGELPVVERVYIAYGSGGSVAGLLIGFALMQVSIRVVAVQATESMLANGYTTRRLVGRALDLIDPGRSLFTEAMSRLERLDPRFLGKGYHDCTIAAKEAVLVAADAGLNLEPVFTGKAMASILSDLSSRPKAPWLFWNTHHAIANNGDQS